MKLFYSPGACSLAARFLLHELDLPFADVKVDLASGEQESPPFLAVNPKGKVPALALDDGRTLTELGAITWWIAETRPARGLLPTDADGLTDVHQLIDYIVGTLHMEGVRLAFSPRSAFAAGDPEAVRAQGMATLARGLAVVAERCPDGAPLLGKLGVADFLLAYILFCATHLGLRLPPGLNKHWRMMSARASVTLSLKEEGFA